MKFAETQTRYFGKGNQTTVYPNLNRIGLRAANLPEKASSCRLRKVQINLCFVQFVCRVRFWPRALLPVRFEFSNHLFERQNLMRLRFLYVCLNFKSEFLHRMRRIAKCDARSSMASWRLYLQYYLTAPN